MTPSHSSRPSATRSSSTKEEAKAYVENQERWQGVRVRKEAPRKRPWMALELEDVQKYDTVKKPERFVPVGGRYLKE
nr:DUF365 domain-containing protein [Methanoculleus bourgensis]